MDWHLIHAIETEIILRWQFRPPSNQGYNIFLRLVSHMRRLHCFAKLNIIWWPLCIEMVLFRTTLQSHENKQKLSTMQSKWSSVKWPQRGSFHLPHGKYAFVHYASIFSSILMRQKHRALFNHSSDLLRKINISYTEYRNKNYFLQENEDFFHLSITKRGQRINRTTEHLEIFRCIKTLSCVVVNLL